MTTDLTGPGTAEELWSAWHRLPTFPTLDLPPRAPAPDRVVLVAPHPDDEVLGAGGTLALLARAGIPVTLVAVTDGEASHPGSPTMSPEALVRARLRERDDAMAELGVQPDTIRCGLADGGVEAHPDRIRDTVADLLTDRSWVLAPWSRDGHPDHDAVGRATVDAARHTGARRLSYLVWTWHWASPDDARVPWDHAVRVDLPDDVRLAKIAAATRFRTQVQPLSEHPADRSILPPPVLARLTRGVEVFLR